MAAKNWFPLESNPDVMNKYVRKMGVDVKKFSFQDVYSTEDWALEMVTRPVIGVVMLYPIKESTEKYSAEEQAKIDKDGQIVSPNTYFMKQTVGNACGTVGILHAVGNVRSQLSIREGSYLDKFFSKTETMAADEIADYLEADDEIEEVHEETAMEGQSEVPEEDVNTHFVCFSVVDGHLYQFDGRKPYPINHGVSSQDTLLEDACRVVKEFMARDPDEVRFTIVALAATPEGAQDDNEESEAEEGSDGEGEKEGCDAEEESESEGEEVSETQPEENESSPV